ncbi:MAG: lysostaphin resistance A-like protein, partial [Nannocystaceae bacterium]
VVLAPIAEEWLMRGLLFARIRRANPVAAYAVTALAFAAIHGNPAGFVVYAWLAIVFAHAMARTGRLSAAIGVHALNNVITLSMLLGAVS